MARTRIVLATPHRRHDRLETALRAEALIEVIRIRAPRALDLSTIAAFDPKYVFFPHWSWKIPKEIFGRFECIIFHMTDLPYGRGGSPLQNLIARGIYETQITALRCVDELDAGPVYLRRPLALYGSAEEIYQRAAELIREMILEIVKRTPQPQLQQGQVTVFVRRRPEDGDLGKLARLEQVFDYIRMLDAEGYPPAFLETEHFRFEFSRASLKTDEIHADVRIKPRASEKST